MSMVTVCTHARLGHRWRVCFASWQIYLDQAKMPGKACSGIFAVWTLPRIEVEGGLVGVLVSWIAWTR